MSEVSEPTESIQHHIAERQNKAERVQNHTLNNRFQTLKKLIEDENVDQADVDVTLTNVFKNQLERRRVREKDFFIDP